MQRLRDKGLELVKPPAQPAARGAPAPMEDGASKSEMDGLDIFGSMMNDASPADKPKPPTPMTDDSAAAEPCQNYTLNLLASQYGLCTCGFSRAEHVSYSTPAEHSARAAEISARVAETASPKSAKPDQPKVRIQPPDHLIPTKTSSPINPLGHLDLVRMTVHEPTHL